MQHLTATPETEVLIEHISVIQERLASVLDSAYPGEGITQIVVDGFEPFRLREELLTLFTPVAFLNLFNTDLGKGVLIGAFMQKFVMERDEE